MKTLMNILLVLSLMITGTQLKAQDETTIVTATEEAQNLDLVAVMDLFKESANLEEFEKLLNDPVKGINNLDLNHDKQADYIRVLETIEGNYRVIVLQSVIGQNDFQDVAVINVERTAQKTVKIVCQGNVDIYGENYYVEPDPTYYVDVHVWPIWTILFAPHYVHYYSPYYWDYYPHYYNHYYVVSYYDYYGRMRPHYNGYYHNHNHAYYQPTHHIYKPQKSERVVYNHTPNRPGNNGIDTRNGNGGNNNGVSSRPGVTPTNGQKTRPNTPVDSRTYTRPTSTTPNTRTTTTERPTYSTPTRETPVTRPAPATRTTPTQNNTRVEPRTTTPPSNQQQNRPTRTVERPQQQVKQAPPATRTNTPPTSVPARTNPGNQNTKTNGGSQRR